MNEELKVIIKAEVDKLKKGIDDAKKQMSGFKEQVQKASGDVDSKMKKMGESIGKAVKTGAKVAVASIATVTTAVASVVTASVKSYAEYEQLAGGVEKLFGKSAETIMKYANSAYKDAGINANQYMTQVTSFSASLISSLNGDTAKSAEGGRALRRRRAGSLRRSVRWASVGRSDRSSAACARSRRSGPPLRVRFSRSHLRSPKDKA